MRSIVLWGVPIRFHVTIPLMVALAIYFGIGQDALIAALSLILHETSHVFAARRLNLPVVELELMPFGGAARIEGLWSLRPKQLFIVALAGPLCNLLIALTTAALGWWGLIDGLWAAKIASVNLTLMLFNLIPALPLDGGRLVTALIGARIGPERAVRVGIWAGRALGALLLAAAAASYFMHNQLNIVLILCALYLIACSERERQSASAAALRSIIDRQSEMSADGALPLRWIALSKDATLADAARAMRPRYMHLLAVYDGLEYIGHVDERQFLTAMMKDPSGQIGKLLFDPTANARLAGHRSL